jgi:hypothetical protein
MTYELMYKSSATERYDTDMNDRVRDYLENAGYKVLSESGGTYLGAPEDDPHASDNIFEVDADFPTVQMLSHEISALLGNRSVLFEQVKTDG